jgi:prepilin-type N-terminal cleavage/methylation domain-containing protein
MRKVVTSWDRAYTLVELVIVVVIIGMIASMAIPRMSRGATGATEATLLGDLATVRTVILRYAIEHRNVFPGPTAARTVAQLTQYSGADGTTSPARDATAIYGPYLVCVPPCPIGYNPGSDEILIDAVNSPPKANTASTAGWIYNPTTGEFYPNASEEQLTKVLSTPATKAAVIVTGG